MFDVIGIVISDNWIRSWKFSWREIVIGTNLSEGSMQNNMLNVIPLRVSRNSSHSGIPPGEITANSWVKVRFSLVSWKYQRDGQDRLCLVAEANLIKVLYAAKPREESSSNKTSNDNGSSALEESETTDAF